MRTMKKGRRITKHKMNTEITAEITSEFESAETYKIFKVEVSPSYRDIWIQDRKNEFQIKICKKRAVQVLQHDPLAALHLERNE